MRDFYEYRIMTDTCTLNRIKSVWKGYEYYFNDMGVAIRDDEYIENMICRLARIYHLPPLVIHMRSVSNHKMISKKFVMCSRTCYIN